MKKIAFFLVLLICLSLIACDTQDIPPQDESVQTTQSLQATESLSHEHQYVQEVIPPSCTTEGYTVYRCSCSDSYTDDHVAAKGHTLSKTVIPSACLENGYTLVECTVCDFRQTEQPTEFLGHSFEQWSISREATLTSNGQRTRQCATCGFTQNESYLHEWNANATLKGLIFNTLDATNNTCEVYVGTCTESVIQVPAVAPNGRIVTAVQSFDGSAATKILLPETITSIPYGAFSNCPNLTELHIPKSVTNIGRLIAENSPKLKTVYYDAVLALHDAAGNLCGPFTNASVEEVIFGDEVTYVTPNLFYGCTTLKRVVLGKEVAEIGANAFVNTPALTQIEWNTAVTHIYANAFNGAGFTSLTLPESLTHISTMAFASLPLDGGELIIPKGLKKLSSLAFFGAAHIGKLTILSPSLTTDSSFTTNAPFYQARVDAINVADSVTALPKYLFSGITGLKEATLGKQVSKVSQHLFQETKSLEKVILQGATAIDTAAFSGCSALHTVEGFQTIKSLGSSAFHGCTALTGIDLSAVTSLGSHCFSGSGLSSVTLPADMTELPQAIFASCKNLKSITLPNTLKKIGIDAFASSGLECITIPDSVMEMGGYAFRYCNSLQSITLSNGLTHLGDFTFEQCFVLKSITLPTALKSIGRGVFSSCTSLEILYIPDTVTFIGDNCFSSCTALREVHIPNAMTTVPDSLFSGCTALKTVHLPQNAVKIGSHAFSYTAIESITLPATCTIVGNGAFYQCQNLKTVDFASVTKIENNAFSHCYALERVILPDCIQSVGLWSFANCTSLTQVYLGKSLTFLDSEAFKNCTGIRTVYLPTTLLSMKVDSSDTSPFLNCGTVCYVEPDSLSSLLYGYFGSVLCGYTYEQYLEAIA